MANPNKVDLSAERLFFLGEGIVSKIVCAPNGWDQERVQRETNAAGRPGTSGNEWVIAEPSECPGADFDGVNHLPCPDDAERVHWLLNC